MQIRIATRSGIQTFDSEVQAISILFEKDEAQGVSQMNAHSNRRFSSVPDTATPQQAIDTARIDHNTWTRQLGNAGVFVCDLGLVMAGATVGGQIQPIFSLIKY